jgi:RHS repeat-associated protein
LSNPIQIHFKDGAIWELDRGINQLQVFDIQGNMLGSYGSKGNGNGQVNDCRGFDFDTVGGFYIGDYNNNRVVRYGPCGSVGTAIPTATGSITPTVTATVTATTTCSAIDYTYDNNGNLTTESRCGAATTYTYDSDNRLTSVVAGGVTTSMVYDYDGNLVQKTVGGQVTRYVYAGGPAPIAEINVTANTEKDFIQTNGRTWGVMEATSNTYFHHDAIGSVVALSNDSGQVTDIYEYEPFGKVLQHQGTSTNDYQFVGGYGVRKLNDTLDTMGVRQYQASCGKFTSIDPLKYKAGDMNFYRYVRNNPLKLYDPSGNNAEGDSCQLGKCLDQANTNYEMLIMTTFAAIDVPVDLAAFGCMLSGGAVGTCLTGILEIFAPAEMLALTAGYKAWKEARTDCYKKYGSGK